MEIRREQLIEYYGIGINAYDKLQYFTQINRDFTFILPKHRPQIEKIIKVWIEPRIQDQKIIETKKGISVDGQRLTGHKLILLGDLFYKIEYMAYNKEQTLHTEQLQTPFWGDIVLPEEMNKHSIVLSNVLIEDIYSDLLNRAQVYNNITMVLVADIW